MMISYSYVRERAFFRFVFYDLLNGAWGVRHLSYFVFFLFSFLSFLYKEGVKVGNGPLSIKMEPGELGT